MIIFLFFIEEVFVMLIDSLILPIVFASGAMLELLGLASIMPNILK